MQNKNRNKSNGQRDTAFGSIRNELRKTHFNLGNDRRNFESQYKHDYIPQEGGHFGPNMDSVLLRRTHFILGDHRNNYVTTNNEQNKNVDPRGRPVIALNDELKNDLRRSHFILGNYKSNMIPCSKQDYTLKNGTVPSKDFGNIGKALRRHSHVLGDTQVEYKSEMHSKYNNPNTTGKQKQMVSTAELQKSHYIFGSSNDPWATTSHLSYGPKEVLDSKLYSKNLTKTNFVLGDDRMPMKSVSHQTYIPHLNQGYSQANKELSADLRQHHFKFGNDKPSMTSINHQDYVPRDLNNARFQPTIDDQTLKRSHFNIGDKAQAAKDHFETTYSKAMNEKGLAKPHVIPNSTFKSSVNIKGKDNNSYISEAAANYNFRPNNVSQQELKQLRDLAKDIKGSHFRLGEGMNDYKTTSGLTYNFDYKKAQDAKGVLKDELINDLRATHYKLGYDPTSTKTTTHMSTYVPLNSDRSGKALVSEELRKSHFNLNTSYNSNVGKTIYMTDYTKKEVVPEECW